MRSVDRVLAALNHEEPDMVPIIEHFTSVEAQDRFVRDRLKGITDPWERKLFLARWWGNDIISVGAGFDSIDPLDPYDGIDLAEIKEKYGERIALRGGISKYIGMWSHTEIAQHVADRLRIGAPEGGYIFGSAGGKPHDMPWENLYYYRQLIVKARRSYGRFG